ncbi:MAG: cytochrome c3 family protein, partial [candidate division Zixibacteria bacterium]|nr:cytochrome c3 family protein [candidate division Zixibacteria bacterium]
CHSALKESLAKGQVHSPVKGGKCVACHEVHAGTHKALLISDKKSLCSKCHNLTAPAMGVAHKGFDISSADCQSCHAPHVGPKGSKGLLLPKSHKPFAQGRCGDCHQGSSTTQFVATGVQLCAKCHSDAIKLTAKPVVHPALEGEGSCTACHSPHVGFGAGLQKKDGVQQCLTCHNTREFTGPVQHKPAFDDCGTCHDPHSSQYKNLLGTSDLMQVCLDCHEDAPKTHYHKMGAGVIDPRTKTELVCTGCHSPHSSTEKSLLIADKNRKLCNLCHGTAHE